MILTVFFIPKGREEFTHDNAEGVAEALYCINGVLSAAASSVSQGQIG